MNILSYSRFILSYSHFTYNILSYSYSVTLFNRGYAKIDLPGIDKRKANFDSEVNLFNSNLQGLEYGTLPPTRSIGLNLKLSL